MTSVKHGETITCIL